MNLLVTGAFSASQEQLDKLSSLGYTLHFQKDERGEAECDFNLIDAVICNGLFLYHDIDEFKNLKFIQLTSAGLDKVPLEKIKERKIALCNARGVYSVPMAEFALACVLDLYKHLNMFYEGQKNHEWKKDRELKELSGQVVSIIGCGSVGFECAKRFKAFDTTIISVDVFNHCNKVYDEFCHISSIESALKKSDIVILTLPLTEKTKGMFNKEMFSSFKDGAILVNISRGAVVDENALIDALEKGKLGGAVLDVFENEPLEESSKLWDMKNVIVTPHNSYASKNNSIRLFNLAYSNLEDFRKGEF